MINLYNPPGEAVSGDGTNGTGVSTIKSNCEYGAWIHNNTIGQETLGTYDHVYGILIEQSASDVIIEKNYIKNTWIPLYFPIEPKKDNTGRSLNNIRISYNIFDQVGGLRGSGSNLRRFGIFFPLDDINFTCNNVSIWNNVIVAHPGDISPQWGIVLPSIGKVTNVSVRNNIISGFKSYAVFGYGRPGYMLDNLSVENNIFYKNGVDSVGYYGIIPTHNITQNNYTTDPSFAATDDFHLSSGSPAIDHGIDVGLPYDYESKSLPIGICSDIGVYEYGSAGGIGKNSRRIEPPLKHRF